MAGIGDAVRRRRKELGLSQVALATRANTFMAEGFSLDQPYLSQIELGKVARPGDEYLDALEQALSLPRGQLRIDEVAFDAWLHQVGSLPPERLSELERVVEQRRRALKEQQQKGLGSGAYC